jgi:hypothetical protein
LTGEEWEDVPVDAFDDLQMWFAPSNGRPILDLLNIFYPTTHSVITPGSRLAREATCDMYNFATCAHLFDLPFEIVEQVFASILSVHKVEYGKGLDKCIMYMLRKVDAARKRGKKLVRDKRKQALKTLDLSVSRRQEAKTRALLRQKPQQHRRQRKCRW